MSVISELVIVIAVVTTLLANAECQPSAVAIGIGSARGDKMPNQLNSIRHILMVNSYLVRMLLALCWLTTIKLTLTVAKYLCS